MKNLIIFLLAVSTVAFVWLSIRNAYKVTPNPPCDEVSVTDGLETCTIWFKTEVQ